MGGDLNQKNNLPDTDKKKWIPTWFKVCVVVLIIIVILKTLGLQVFVEIDYDEKPFLTSLTEIETYFIPLGLLLVYFVAAWIWDTFIRSKDP